MSLNQEDFSYYNRLEKVTMRRSRIQTFYGVEKDLDEQSYWDPFIEKREFQLKDYFKTFLTIIFF